MLIQLYTRNTMLELMNTMRKQMPCTEWKKEKRRAARRYLFRGGVLGKYGVLLGGGEKMSVVHRIPGLFLMVLCHVVVIYHLLERRHSKRKFVLLSCLYAAGFVSMGAYMYTVSGITMLLTYLGVAVYLFLFSILSQRNVFLRKAFCFLLILACFPS
ncbi:hypothetical protein C807_02903 [Lachnospiraceae bacterium 28-4]|nr:hypothetical protein C807_02903 [Lachnospiraceae bacterium 28-4]